MTRTEAVSFLVLGETGVGIIFVQYSQNPTHKSVENPSFAALPQRASIKTQALPAAAPWPPPSHSPSPSAAHSLMETTARTHLACIRPEAYTTNSGVDSCRGSCNTCDRGLQKCLFLSETAGREMFFPIPTTIPTDSILEESASARTSSE
ncbi:uncharacterized protein LOC131166037 [Malania oleifera]|uniref:uncharacterized protein LOC131166037 n=1 Tax=Malania oleifera TaxID=397392 RepID=UPI0025AE4767|nr:uncharacterized protein LOC131166037 [Malania oleifera]